MRDSNYSPRPALGKAQVVMTEQCTPTSARVLAEEVFIAAPGDCTVHALTCYTSPHAPHLLSIHALEYRDDTNDLIALRRSEDDGRSWRPLGELSGCEAVEGRFVHRRYHGPYLERSTGRCLQMRSQALLPTDRVTGAAENWRLHYAVFEDGDILQARCEPVIHGGHEYDADHPLPGVWIGRNAAMIGDHGSRPMTLPDGTLLVPIQISCLDDAGRPYNPCGAMTWHESAVLIGRWRHDRRITWQLSHRVRIDPARSYRGLIEPTRARLEGGRLLMVLRGSNSAWPNANPAVIPGYKWCCFSDDGGMTWSDPRPWTDTDGQPFCSPSSCSELFAHSGGRLLWFGNITPGNPAGNAPRYPLVLAEVDRRTGLLIRPTITVIDTRRPGEPEGMTLSNFRVREERSTRHLLVHVPRAGALPPPPGQSRNWRADARLNRIELL